MQLVHSKVLLIFTHFQWISHCMVNSWQRIFSLWVRPRRFLSYGHMQERCLFLTSVIVLCVHICILIFICCWETGPFGIFISCILASNSTAWLCTWWSDADGDLHSTDTHRFLAQPLQLPVRAATPSPAGAPIILAPRLPTAVSPMAVTSAGIINGAPPPLMSAPGDGGLMTINPYEHHYPYGLSATPILEYSHPHHMDPTGGAGMFLRWEMGGRYRDYLPGKLLVDVGAAVG